MENTVGLLDFIEFGDERGALVSLEARKNIPFDIKRVYYIFRTSENIRRGCHAHKDLKQVLICTSGACTVSVYDGSTTEEYRLDTNTQGLYIGSMIWRELHHFSKDCVVMVLASNYHIEDDYIRDLDQFEELLKK